MAFNWDAAKTKADYRKLKYEDIVEYCEKNGKTDWLISAADRLEAEYKNGEHKRTWGIMQLRSLFLNEVLAVSPKPASKPKTLYERIMTLKQQ